MPELPEVETARALIERRGLGREVVEVDDADTWVCRPHGPGEIAAALTGRSIAAARRRGKAMWVETSDGGPDLGIHLGMSGRIVIDDEGAGDPKDFDDARARERGWDRFTLRFADGGQLALRDPRRLGRVRLEPDLSGVGPDAALIGRDAFRERVGRGTAPLKARLMDQAVLAGVGNLLADETLWRARLSPVREAGSLSVEELDGLRRTLRAATRRAIERGGVHTGDLIPHRRPRSDHRCPRCRTDLVRDAVGGRTTWWCPACQPG